MFLVIDHQNSRQQFDFVAEKLERDRAGQKGGIHENTFSERDIVRHLLWLIEDQSACGIGRSKGLSGKADLNVADREFRLINEHCGDARRTIGERDLPWPIAGAPVFDALIKNRINN